MHASINSVSSGLRVCISTTDALIPSDDRVLAAEIASFTITPHAIMQTSLPSIIKEPFPIVSPVTELLLYILGVLFLAVLMYEGPE